MDKYIVHAGCSINAEYYPVMGKLKEVENWAWQTALEEVWEGFCDYHENELIYSVKPFDETNEKHLDYLEWNGGEFIEV